MRRRTSRTLILLATAIGCAALFESAANAAAPPLQKRCSKAQLPVTVGQDGRDLGWKTIIKGFRPCR